METRFSFHPVKKLLLVSFEGEAHSDSIAKRGKKLPFDGFIRGIIIDNKLYLRMFYPFKDIDNLTGDEIRNKSFDLLFDSRNDLLKALKSQGIVKPLKIAYNVNNDDLKGILVNI